MFKRILIATDGSPLSRSAISAGVELGKLTRATIVGLHARPPMGFVLYGDARIMVPPETEPEYERRVKAVSDAFVAEIEAAARRADLSFEAISVEDASPADAIVRIARERDCDLIVMASHGRKGVSRILIGSETIKALTHATQPVLVTR